MNIGLVAPYDLARSGGVTSHIRAQARALRARGHAVSIYGPASAPLPAGETALSGATTVSFGGTTSGAGFDPRCARRAARAFADERFDVVHVHEPLMPLVPWCAVWFARAPVVGTFHVHRENGHRFYPLARPLLQTIMRRLSVRIAVSEASLRTASASFPGTYEVIPNGIEPARFAAAQPRPRGLPAPGATVLCVGRLEPRKGVGVLIEAMAAVRRRVPAAALVVVGDGPDRQALADLARRLDARVTFAREVADDQLPAFYQAADAICAPALGGESFGIVLLEALAAGKPVVASRIEGYAAAVGEASCVRLVAAGDAAALAGAIVDVLRNRRPADQADAARIVRAHDWDRIASRLESVYERLQARAIG